VPRAAVAAIPLVLVPALGLLQGGFHPDTWVWAGALCAWAGCVALVLGSTGRLSRDFWWIVLGAALLGWTLASALWSAEPAQSVLDARRTLVYASVALAFVVLARRGASGILLAATHAGVTALVVYALARYLFGSRPFLEFEGRLLAEPLGYANAVGILAAMAVLLALGRPVSRVAAGATVPLLALALDLSGSHASWLALAIGLAATTLLHPDRRSLVRTLAALAPAALVAVGIGELSGLTSPGSARTSGLSVALAATACAVGGGLLAGLAAKPEAPPSAPGRASRRRGVVLAPLLAVAAAGIVAVAVGGATEPRISYYRVAWHEYLAHPALGSGAGTFGRYWLASGRVPELGGALDAHSLYLETLAELGPIGLCLVAAFLGYPLAAAVARRRSPLVAPAAGAVTAFLVHAGLDWDWELPAVVVAALSCAAVAAFADGDGESEVPASPRVRAVVLAAALVAGLAAIAGARSTAEPSASPIEREAPPGGASLLQRRGIGVGYLPE
jgi:O-antigen ligase/polysaccharide polymerase Wzy-like membrane protein